MVLDIPFARWAFLPHPDYLFCRGGLYCVFTVQESKKVVAISYPSGCDGFVYRGIPSFVKEYGLPLCLGTVNRWESEDELIKWLQVVIYNSFAYGSVGGVECCWYVMRLVSAEFTQAIPVGLQQFIQFHGRATSVVFRHGYRVWSVDIVNHRFSAGWPEFCGDHGLLSNCTVILGCERKWLFNVIILDEDESEMEFPWSAVSEGWDDLFPKAEWCPTSCLPSVVENEFMLQRFGCFGARHQSIFMVFLGRLLPFVEVFGLNEVRFSIGAERWIIPVVNGRLDRDAFDEFIGRLQLEGFDYLFAVVSLDMEVRLIVFGGHNNCEKVFSWCKTVSR